MGPLLHAAAICPNIGRLMDFLTSKQEGRGFDDHARVDAWRVG